MQKVGEGAARHKPTVVDLVNLVEVGGRRIHPTIAYRFYEHDVTLLIRSLFCLQPTVQDVSTPARLVVFLDEKCQHGERNNILNIGRKEQAEIQDEHTDQSHDDHRFPTVDRPERCIECY